MRISKEQLRRLVLEAVSGDAGPDDLRDDVDYDYNAESDSGQYVPGKYDKYLKGGPRKGELNPAFGRDIQTLSVSPRTTEQFQEALANKERIKEIVIELNRMYRKDQNSSMGRMYPIKDDHYHKVDALLNDLDINKEEFMLVVGAVVERYYH